MGRYYYGDIEGKFWFAVQPSDAADRFGVCGQTPNYLEYYFDKESLSNVEKELKNIEKDLGDYKQKLDDYFTNGPGYNPQELSEALGLPNTTKGDVELRYILGLYADYELGVKIRDCIKENGECSFDAEL